MQPTSNSVELDSTSLTTHGFLIYVDRLGTTSLVREDDSIYGNRAGFYEMAPLYVEPYEALSEILGNRFKYFGFSDTILAVSNTDDAMAIGKAASKIFAALLDYSIACRVFITYGDFSFHRFEQLAEKKDTFLCPIYGSTLLDAYQMDQLGIKCLGAFASQKVIEQFHTLQNAAFFDKSATGLLDLNKYLSEDEVTKIQGAADRLSRQSKGVLTAYCQTLNAALAGKAVMVETNCDVRVQQLN